MGLGCGCRVLGWIEALRTSGSFAGDNTREEGMVVGDGAGEEDGGMDRR